MKNRTENKKTKVFWNVHRRLLYFQLKIACILYIVSCNLYPVSYILSSILVLLLINIWCTLVSRFSSLIYNFHINLKILRYQEKGVCEKGMEGGKKGGMWEGDGGRKGKRVYLIDDVKFGIFFIQFPMSLQILS